MSNLEDILKQIQERNANNMREIKRDALPKSLRRVQDKIFSKGQTFRDFVVIEDDNSSVKSEKILERKQEQENCLSQESSVNSVISVKSVKTLKWTSKQVEAENVQDQFFKNLSIIFFMKNLTLSQKRIDIFTKQIKLYGGKVYSSLNVFFEERKTLYDLIKKQDEYPEQVYLMAGEDAKIEEVKKILEVFGQKVEEILRNILSSEFLVSCLKDKKKHSTDHYFLFRDKVDASRQLNELTEKISSGQGLKQKEKSCQQPCKNIIKQEDNNSKVLKSLSDDECMIVSINTNSMQNINSNAKIECCSNNIKSEYDVSKIKNIESQLINSCHYSEANKENKDLSCNNDSLDLQVLTKIPKEFKFKLACELRQKKIQKAMNANYLWDYQYDSDAENSKQLDNKDDKQKEISQKLKEEYVQSKIVENNKKLKKTKEDQYSSLNFKNFFQANVGRDGINSLSSKFNQKKEVINGEQDIIIRKQEISNATFDQQNKNNSLEGVEKQVDISFEAEKQLFSSQNLQNCEQQCIKFMFQKESESSQESDQEIDCNLIKELPPSSSNKHIFQQTEQENQNGQEEEKEDEDDCQIIDLTESQQIQFHQSKNQNFLAKRKQKSQEKKEKMQKQYQNEESPFRPFKGQEQINKYWDERKSHFVCATGAAKMNLNIQITQELEKLLKVYQQEKDLGRQIAYRKAIAVIKSLQFEITSVKQVSEIMGIGQKIRDKIKEIIQTGKCYKAQFLSQNERNVGIDLLSKVWGIGPTTAASLFDRGIRSIQNLRDNQDVLNKNQRIGLKYFEDLNQRMPRGEASQIVEVVNQGLKHLYEEEFDKFEVNACGSYRRGKETCGDVDILISRKDGEECKPKGFMMNLINHLEKQGVLIENLQMPRPGTYGSESYMGICKVLTVYRRIDIKYYPRDLYGYAILYFTGSDYFNRSMRLFARKKGYSLSDHGLYQVSRIGKNNKITSGLAIPCYTEQEVFSALNLEYKDPSQRSV